MVLIPEFKIGWLNGWITLVIYFVCLIQSVSLYSKESRQWLFNNPKDESNKALSFIRLFGQLIMITYIVMMIFTPIQINHLAVLIGTAFYALGFILEMSALYHFRLTRINEPVVGGPYNISRNPQWVGLFLVLLGSAIMVRIWLYIGMVICVGFIYHIQILDEEKICLAKYGESYRAYMKKVPRYLLLF